MDERTPGIRPRPSLRRRLDIAARTAFPGAATALMLLVAAGPLGLPAQAQLESALVLGSVFFWSLYRPASLPPLLVFALGVLADLIGYGPVGAGVLVLLIAHGLAMRWRRWLARHGFLVVWLAFVAVAAGGAALEWAVGSLLAFRLLPLAPMAFQAMVAAGLYPLLSVVLNRAHGSIAEPARA